MLPLWERSWAGRSEVTLAVMGSLSPTSNAPALVAGAEDIPQAGDYVSMASHHPSSGSFSAFHPSIAVEEGLGYHLLDLGEE